MKPQISSEVRANLSRDIKELRGRIGLSQEALALAAGIDRTYVSQIERQIANPSLEILYLIACALGVSLSVKFEAVDPLNGKLSR